MNENNYRPMAICSFCKSNILCGETCKKCSADKNIHIANYAVAVKEAIGCWQDANCQEHEIPCQPTVREFAEKLMKLNHKIRNLEMAILNHKFAKKNADEVDNKLWSIMVQGADYESKQEKINDIS